MDTTALCAPWDEGLLDTGDGHRIRFEQSGNPLGLPVLSLHGGPGSGARPRLRTFFDPARYRIVLFDQRGCGRSAPLGRIEHNTLAHLVADIEALRRHLGIARWLVCGGSWGACLALAYATAHRNTCLGLLLRSVFLGTREEIDWFFHGARRVRPAAWEAFAAPAPPARRGDLLACYAEAVNDPDPARALTAAQRWRRWETALGQPDAAPPDLPAAGSPEATALIARYRVQAHYLRHDCFIAAGGVLADAGRLAGLPVALVHGRADQVCRLQAARRVHAALPGSRLYEVPDAGHDPFAHGMFAALYEAAAHFYVHGDFRGWDTDDEDVPSATGTPRCQVHGFR
ncbi:prolyl aminopeptidase [Thauera sp. CAU 1555]|uniref:Proline iminopeptidase n=1 Tax=Thauera sedimentorum TaxID=2767595 RepID=A0ABR9BB59_9RHOO|nr:prolyl aminopeptidase [Thauera sedimentorum]MBC9071753.1 prolyl aminopeptidase [Thauera sedimentorum]MBD8502672.1 prolyl aminopeptidase [Thauera sedimentorum]